MRSKARLTESASTWRSVERGATERRRALSQERDRGTSPSQPQVVRVRFYLDRDQALEALGLRE
jgi:hypothetical protein